MEDFGLQAILEKMNSLITPLISGPFWDISNIFQKFLIFSQSLSKQKIQTAEKSRGWFEIGRVLDQIDRVGANYFSNKFRTKKRANKRTKQTKQTKIFETKQNKNKKKSQSLSR